MSLSAATSTTKVRSVLGYWATSDGAALGTGHGAEPVRRLRRALGLRGLVILFSATRCCRRASVMAVPIHQPAARFAQLSQMLRGVPLIVCCLHQRGAVSMML